MRRGFIFLSYNCVMYRRQRSEKCKAKVHNSRRAKDKIYKVERLGYHNHGLVAPSKRHNQTVQKLVELFSEYEGSSPVNSTEKRERASGDGDKSDLAPSPLKK